MERISELLDNVSFSEGDSDCLRWMTEATNRIQELEYKVDRLLKESAGEIELVSNDPTELELYDGARFFSQDISQEKLDKTLEERGLHVWIFAEELDESTGLPQMRCSVCGVAITECGSTDESWRCSG